MNNEDPVKAAIMAKVATDMAKGKYTLTVKRHHSDKPKVGGRHLDGVYGGW